MSPMGKSTALYDACVYSNWEAVIALCSCEAKPEDTANLEAYSKGEYGRKCLHCAVRKMAPCGVIHAILDAHKDCPVRITRLTNECGKMALHVAAAWIFGSYKEAAILKVLVESDPHCATMRDKDGCTPLHYMVSVFYRGNKKSAMRVACTRALLNACTTESILAPTDKYKSTALHGACFSSGISPEVLQIILEHCPQAALAKDAHGDTPLHCASCNDNDSDNDNDDFNCAKITLLLESLTMQGQSGTVAVNNDGQSPLHFAVCCADKNGIKLLLDSQPESVCVKDKDGVTPLDLVQTVYAQTMQCKTFEQVMAGRFRPDFECRFMDVCERCNLLVETMFSVLHGHEKLTWKENLWMTAEEDRRIDQEPLEHAMIHNYLRLGLSCPLDFVHILVHLYPHQTQMKDARGDLPLHIALENGVQHAKRKPPLFRNCKTNGNDNSVLLNKLIDAYPQAAKVPNRNGDLPLHILLQSRVGNSGWHYCAQHLLRAHPSALLHEEANSWPVLLLPLILSTMGEGKDLSALYEFVREMPHLCFEVTETTTPVSEQGCKLQALRIE